MADLADAKLRDPGVRRASILSCALWSIGYLIYIFVAALGDGALPGPALCAAYLLQYGTALVLARALMLAIRRMLAWPTPARWAGTAIAVPILAAALAIVDNASLIFLATHGHPDMSPWARWSLVWATRTVFLYFWVFCVDAALVLLAFTIEQVRASERELAEVRATAAQAQLAMLRYQLNPHFLFNTLNAISSLVVTGRVTSAEEMIERLSAFLRETLTSDPAGLVSVEEELALAQDYLAIESVRFGERLRVTIECDAPAGQAQVPSFILQPLVENAIKHGVGPSMTPVTVSIAARLAGEQVVLRVCDDGQGSGSPGTGVGLRNTRQRLAALYRADASVATGREECGYVVELRLPARPLPKALAA